MAKRRPQINFQVDEAMKMLYEEARAQGHWVTRFCAAGFLAVVEDPALRHRAIQRLRDWEAQFEHASPKQIRAFVEGAAAAMQAPAQGNRPARKAPPPRKRARRSESE
ncbi:hypothetical protein RAS1_43700 [Phycisphaerae bacterium RAS1]|nr:hypothetical protein RAS1_43700 [Phycisphaerae bacterium RAS1]